MVVVGPAVGADVPGTDVATAPPHATKTAAAAMMGQCHNPQLPVFLHEPHWPPACARGRPIQPDCPIKTVARHLTAPEPRTTAWLTNLLDATKERKGRPGSLGRPFDHARRTALAVHLPRLAWTNWRPLFPNLRRPREFNSAGFSLNGRRPSVRMCHPSQRHSPDGTIHLPTNMNQAPAFDNRRLMTLQLAARRG